MVIKMNVPKLRFNDFNDDYQNITIGDVLKIKSGRDQKQVENKNGIYPILGTSGQIGRTNSFLYDKPSVLIGRKGTINKPQYMDTPFWTVDTLFYSDIFKPNVPKYIYYLFQNINWNKYDESTGVPSLNCKTIESIKTSIPSVNEQNKIAKFLSLLDKKIELQSQKIEALKLYKKGLLLNYFKGKKTNKIIKDIIKYGKAGGTPKSSVKEYYNGKIPFLSISDMTKQGKYIYNTERNISEIGLKNSSAWLVPEDSIILSMYASYGLVAINKIKLSTSQAMFNMILNDNVFVEYIYQYLNYLNISNYYDKLISTGTQSNLNAEKIYNIKIFIPEFNEQKLIANLLNCIDILIEFNIKKKKNYHKLKKGLMQNMFV